MKIDNCSGNTLNIFQSIFKTLDRRTCILFNIVLPIRSKKSPHSCPQLKIVVFVRSTTLRSRQGINTFIWSTISWKLWYHIYLYSSKKCWRDSVALKGHASHTGLSRIFILLSVVFRARVLVLASNFNLDDWNSTTLVKYGCLPGNIQTFLKIQDCSLY